MPFVFGYLFEEMATTAWDGDKVTPIDAFLKTRGWREAPSGRRHLQALKTSEQQLFEITAVEPGKWVEVHSFGTDARSLRVVEHAASQSLHLWGALVARVYPEGKSNRFTGGMLPMSPDAAVKKMLGQIEIRRDALIFQTNSVERGRIGLHLIESLLGSWAGPARGVHENLADLVNRLSPDQTLAPDDPSLQDNPEVQALLQKHLMEHYRRTLDEPILMLDNYTPRACAADPEKRQSVVD